MRPSILGIRCGDVTGCPAFLALPVTGNPNPLDLDLMVPEDRQLIDLLNANQWTLTLGAWMCPRHHPGRQFEDRALLDEAEDVLHGVAMELLLHRSWLDRPFTGPNPHNLSPWTRSAGRLAKEAHDLAAKIRKHLGITFRRPQRGLGTPPLETREALWELLTALPDDSMRVLVVDDARPDHPWFGKTLPVRGIGIDDQGRAVLHAHVNSIPVG